MQGEHGACGSWSSLRCHDLQGCRARRFIFPHVRRGALAELLDVAPTALGNLVHAYNPTSGTLDTRNNAEQAQDPGGLVCSLLKSLGQSGPQSDCAALRKLFAALPQLPTANPVTGAAPSAPTGIDRTLGGILAGNV
jgi:phospholipid/cholesterol/gamma-HCH transport system substrate-binding protein